MKNQHFRLSAPPSPRIGVTVVISENVIPARAGTTFSQIDAKWIAAKNYVFAFQVPPGVLLSHLARKADLQKTSEQIVLFAHGPPLWLPLVF